MIVVAMNRKIRIGRGLALFLVSLAVTAGMLYLSGLGAISVMIVVGLAYPFVWLASRPMSGFMARIKYSIRWKFEFAIAAIAALFLLISLVNYGAMQFMHREVHDIKSMIDPQPSPAGARLGAAPFVSSGTVREALDDLEEKQHGFLFKMTPVLASVGVLFASGLGAAMAWSVINPVRKMGQAMRRISSGDFSRPLEVDNKDELGDLADHINDAGQELDRLQTAVLVEERGRALRERMAGVRMAEEEERRRISRELHDGLGPSLAAIGNTLRAARRLVRTDPDSVERQLEEVADSIKGHIKDVRTLIGDLRPVALDQLGLVRALDQMTESFRQETGVQASFNASGEASVAPLGEITIYRVVQECLNNVKAHARASRVEVTLETAGGAIGATVEDDGRGFDPLEVPVSARGKGVGLLSMPERAQLLGGTFSVESSPGNGCKAVLNIPLAEVGVGAHSGPVG